MFYQTMEVSVSGDNKRLIKIIYVDHGVQHQLSINVPFYFPIWQLQCWLKDADISGLLLCYNKN